MSTVINIQQLGLLVDLIYHNSKRSEKKTLKQLAADGEVSVNTITKVRQILIDMELLIVIGERRNQVSYWNTNKSQPNPEMLRNIYKIYIQDYKVRVKEERKSRGKISLEKALQVIVSMGYRGVISRNTLDGYITTIEQIDLSKVGEGD